MSFPLTFLLLKYFPNEFLQLSKDFNVAVSVSAGDIPCDNSLLRQVSSLLRRLPAIDSEKFRDDFLMVSAF